jgi:hypothetical protein
LDDFLGRAEPALCFNLRQIWAGFILPREAGTDESVLAVRVRPSFAWYDSWSRPGRQVSNLHQQEALPLRQPALASWRVNEIRDGSSYSGDNRQDR